MDDRDIVNFNVGGTRFATSKQTLTWVSDSFFSSLVSGRIPSIKDSTGAIFIDRDPSLFASILNYLRTKDIDVKHHELTALKKEAEYYGISPLVNRLSLCCELMSASCGGVLFHGFIPPPELSHSDADPLEAFKCKHGLEYGEGAFHSIPVSGKGKALRQVTLIKGHHNWIAAAYPHNICIYKIRERSLWHCIWTSPHMEQFIERLAINAKAQSGTSKESTHRLVAASYGSSVRLWQVTSAGEATDIGNFNLTVCVDELLFIGSQLVALGKSGKLGVWHSMSQHWQVQDVTPITSFDVAGTNLLLGCRNGSIYYIDMQKFPLRMKDNDLLISELFHDVNEHAITALSVYVSPTTSISGNRVELAYGTHQGTVNIIIQHPETVGRGPQLFQTFSVHKCPVARVDLSDKHLLSVCTDYNHVRTWSITRFRGMISTQPGPLPRASFKLLSLEDVDPLNSYRAGNHVGPYGDSSDDQQIFVQKVLPETDMLYIRLAATGHTVCLIRSTDGSEITSFCVHDCEGSSRMGSRPRRYLFTGHSNGSLQVWDLTTALDLYSKNETVGETPGGPTASDLVSMLEFCDVSNSRHTTPNVSPSPSLLRGISQRSLTQRGCVSTTSTPQSPLVSATRPSTAPPNVQGSNVP